MAVTDDAIATIKQMILDGELRPGDRLPPEADLAAQLGLSRSSMREAFKALEMLRILDVRRGDGTYVTSLEPRLLLESMSFVLSFHESHAVLEVLEVRRTLESATAALAAQRVRPEQIEAMRAKLSEVDERTAPEELVSNDIEFHRLIAEATDNAYFVSLLETISSQTARARIWRALAEDNACARTLNEHRLILEALERRDPELARSLMTVHVCGVENWLRGTINETARS